MINYILADMIFTYPLQLTFFILLLMSHSLLKQISLKEIISTLEVVRTEVKNR